MKRAAVVAYAYTAVAIIDDQGGKDARRVVALSSCATDDAPPPAAIVAVLRGYDVERVAFDTAGATTSSGTIQAAARLLSDVRAELVKVGIGIDDVAHDAKQAARAKVRTLKGWPPTKSTYEFQAGALAIAACEPEAPPLANVLEQSVEVAAKSEVREQKAEQKAEEKPKLPDEGPVLGRVVIAIDPGLSPVRPGGGGRRGGTGVVVAAGDVAPLRILDRRTIPTGRWVEFPRPQKKNGRTKTGDTVLDWPDILKVAEEIAAIAIKHKATVAIVERSTYVFGTAPIDVVRAAEVGAVVAEWMREHGIDVIRENVSTVRARVTKGAKVKGESRDNAIGRAVREGFPRWPTSGDTTDERDAAALALFVALPPPPIVVRSEGARTSPVKDKRDRRGRSRPGRENALAAKKAERESAGCTCKLGGRHVAGCPLQDKNKRGGRPRKSA